MPTGHYRFRRSFGNVSRLFRGARIGDPFEFTGLLDDFPGASAAYSLRLINRAFRNEGIVSVRRLSDSDVAFVKVDTSFAIPRVTLNSPIVDSSATFGDFVAGTDGLVDKWIDQSVSDGNNATQGDATAQPKIVDNGAMIVGGIDFDGADDVLNLPPSIITSIDSVSSFVVSQFRSTGGTRLSLALSWNDPDKRYYSPVLINGNVNLGYGESITAISHGTADTNPHLYSSTSGVTTTESYIDGVSSGTVASTSGFNALTNGGIGGFNDSLFVNGSITEIIVYPSDESDSRVGIDTNINDFYNLF